MPMLTPSHVVSEKTLNKLLQKPVLNNKVILCKKQLRDKTFEKYLSETTR